MNGGLSKCYSRIGAIFFILAILLGLFVLGKHSFAVNLVPSPWDKILHGSIFSLLAYCIGLASGLHGCSRLIAAVLGALLIGALDEWHQVYLPGRTPEWSDLAADATGSLIGALILTLGHPKHAINTLRQILIKKS